MKEAPKDVAFGLAWVLDHADTAEKQEAAVNALIFKTDVLCARVFTEAAGLGVLQLHLSGGKPAPCWDLMTLVKAAPEAGLYTNLITSTIGLSERRLHQLDEAGLDHIQLSLQGTDAVMADKVGGYRDGFDRKIKKVEWIKQIGFRTGLWPISGIMAAPSMPIVEPIGCRILAKAVSAKPSILVAAAARLRPWSGTPAPPIRFASNLRITRPCRTSQRTCGRSGRDVCVPRGPRGDH